MAAKYSITVFCIIFTSLFCAAATSKTALKPAARPEPQKNYFKESYSECHKDFSQIFEKVKKSNKSAEIHQFQYSEGIINSYYIPAKKNQKNLLILISGTHGVEAFAGSAVQRWLLDKNLQMENTGMLFIHGFNLYGFKNFRRVNENNIDLNRNFVLGRELNPPDDTDYAKLNSFLNPDHSVRFYFMHSPLFILNSVIKITFNSMESLRRSILKGQYSFPKGLYYGGTQHEPQAYLINDLVHSYAKPYKKIVLVDLHTGYGEKNKLHLLAGKSDEDNSVKLMKIFSKDEINFADQDKFYSVQGEMAGYFVNQLRLNVDAEISAVIFEFGTMDSQKTLGSIESLRRMVMENQNFHYPADKETSASIKYLFREMFYPSDPTWRAAVMSESEKKLKKVFAYFNQNQK